jgi:hypothetical protein
MLKHKNLRFKNSLRPFKPASRTIFKPVSRTTSGGTP